LTFQDIEVVLTTIRIISLMAPMLRRIITNERQRRYADQSRRGQKKVKDNSPSVDLPSDAHSNREATKTRELTSNPTSLLPGIYENPTTSSPLNNQIQESSGESTPHQNDTTLIPSPEIQFQIHVMFDGSHIQPKHIVSLSADSSFMVLYMLVTDLLRNTMMELHRIRALGPGGLIELSNEEQYDSFNKEVKANEWMDGEVKVLVEVQKRMKP
jgi:hypothetical protein